MSYQGLDVSEHGSSQDPREKRHEVQAGEGPDQNVQRENFLTALYSNKLKVIIHIVSTGKQSKPHLLFKVM